MTVETVRLAPDYAISRVVRGGWQLAGGHGPIDKERAIDALIAAFDAGLTTFDCADIYTGVEELHGALRSRLLATRGAEAAANLKVHTKLVPDLSLLPNLRPSDVEAIVDRSLRRLRVERLDLVQLHWWDYAVPGWLDAIGWLDRLSAKGKVRHVGGTNFDRIRVEAILNAGIRLLSMQVQYSLLDPRPEGAFADFCRSRGVALLCYGAAAGGFLSERWLGAAEPTAPLENRSLVKYKLIVDDFGGWGLLQDLLSALKAIADRRGADIASVASRAMLDRPEVAAVIVGARSSAHVAANAAATALRLDPQDHAEIAAVTSRRRGPCGEVYELERDRAGRHGAIMKYNLNREVA